MSQRKYELAEERFLRCMNTGDVYDVRIRKECVNQLLMIQALTNSPVDRGLEAMRESFEYRDRDFIFLVNQSRVTSKTEHIYRRTL